MKAGALAQMLPIQTAVDPKTGRYDAKQLAALLDWSQAEIAQYLERSAGTVTTSPTAQALQDKLADLAALYRDLIELFSPPQGDADPDLEAMRLDKSPLDPPAAVRAWLRTPLRTLGHSTPKARILTGNFTTVRALVDSLEDSAAAT